MIFNYYLLARNIAILSTVQMMKIKKLITLRRYCLDTALTFGVRINIYTSIKLWEEMAEALHWLTKGQLSLSSVESQVSLDHVSGKLYCYIISQM